MSILDPDSSTAKRFQRERIAEKIFIGACVKVTAEPTKFTADDFAGAAFAAADAFMRVMVEQRRAKEQIDD